MSDPLRGERREAPSANNFVELSKLRDQGFNMLVDMTAVDYKPQAKSPRFDVIYRLMKLDEATGDDNGRVELHCAVDESPILSSVKNLWPNADWLEREVWDMFGIKFSDRPGIKRLLMYEEFVGHALRKDYPIAKRQPLIGPKSGDKADSPSFNILKPTVTGE
jgi:NADH-quinone oxidoreductase subunit C